MRYSVAPFASSLGVVRYFVLLLFLSPSGAVVHYVKWANEKRLNIRERGTRIVAATGQPYILAEMALYEIDTRRHDAPVRIDTFAVLPLLGCSLRTKGRAGGKKKCLRQCLNSPWGRSVPRCTLLCPHSFQAESNSISLYIIIILHEPGSI